MQSRGQERMQQGAVSTILFSFSRWGCVRARRWSCKPAAEGSTPSSSTIGCGRCATGCALCCQRSPAGSTPAGRSISNALSHRTGSLMAKPPAHNWLDLRSIRSPSTNRRGGLEACLGSYPRASRFESCPRYQGQLGVVGLHACLKSRRSPIIPESWHHLRA